ncbi:hypothetical protein E1091_01265 [Micromonospora fluostatini]|uniref:DNA-binding protein n=1 Tax=Micromonospora fluostatini TaxID=1629071 RepID=A0ABY2DMF1_9ACTN|nr:hypothetical protein E1091_01265 [Micromonospora fluostatini]
MTLREVSQLYNIPLRDLRRHTASGFAPSIPIGEGIERVHRRMTVTQVLTYLDRRGTQAAARDKGPQPVEDDPIRLAQEASRKQLARHSRRRANRY